MTLPAVALALGLVGVYSRYIRSSMLVALSQPYAVVARAKGLSEGRVVVRHALRNSLIPFVSALSLEIGAIVGASMAADWVFSMGGVASLTIGALGRADPFEMTAVVITLSLIVIVFMTLADLVVGWLDPRARLAAAS
jgi:peptide/nickel transport system permease protein